MTTTKRRAALAFVLVAAQLGGAAIAAGAQRHATERFTLQRSELSAPAPGSGDGRYRLDARLAPRGAASQAKRTGGFELRAQVKSLAATCGAVDPLFVDSYE